MITGLYLQELKHCQTNQIHKHVSTLSESVKIIFYSFDVFNLYYVYFILTYFSKKLAILY